MLLAALCRSLLGIDVPAIKIVGIDRRDASCCMYMPSSEPSAAQHGESLAAAWVAANVSSTYDRLRGSTDAAAAHGPTPDHARMTLSLARFMGHSCVTVSGVIPVAG